MTAQELHKASDGEGIFITCGHCGKPSGWSAWTKTEINGPLPTEDFQCPKCGRAFSRRRTDREYPYPAVEIVPIPSRL